MLDCETWCAVFESPLLILLKTATSTSQDTAEIQNILFFIKVRDRNSKLVPVLLKQLKNLQQQAWGL